MSSLGLPPQNILRATIATKARSPKPATPMRAAPLSKGPGLTGIPRKSVVTANCGWKRCPKPSRTAVGKPRCGSANAPDHFFALPRREEPFGKGVDPRGVPAATGEHTRAHCPGHSVSGRRFPATAGSPAAASRGRCPAGPGARCARGYAPQCPFGGDRSSPPATPNGLDALTHRRKRRRPDDRLR
jgi:hypothetical protein